MATDEVKTFTVDKDGAIVVKEGETPVRYVKESDLLAVKGGKESAENKLKEAESTRTTAIAEATSKVDVEKNRALKAEAKVSTLEEQLAQLKTTGGTTADVARLTAELATAKSSSETLGNKHLELRRSVIVATYNVPKETVMTKDLAALDLFEEALKAVMGNKKVGNFAVGAGGGGVNALQGKRPMELAVEAYSHNK